MNYNYKIKIVYDLSSTVPCNDRDIIYGFREGICENCNSKYCGFCNEQIGKDTTVLPRYFRIRLLQKKQCIICQGNVVYEVRRMIPIQHELKFRGRLLTIDYSKFRKNEIQRITNQFEYIKKVNIVIRTQKKTKNKSMIFEALCSRELSLNDLREFVKKVKRVGFSSNSTVSFINIETIPNIYIHQISFETGILNHGCVQNKSDSDYSSYVILDKTESEPKGEVKPKPLEKCNSCGGKGVGLVSENGFCEHCNRTKQLYSCSVCNKQFSTNSGKYMHFKMKHKFVENENNPLFSQVLESLQAQISDFEEPIYHTEKQSQLAQVEEEFVSLLSIPDSEKPIYNIDTSGLCHMGSVEPLTDYLITLFVVMYWKKHRLIVRQFYMVNIVQILRLKYLPH